MTPAFYLPPLDTDCYRILIEDLRVELRLGVKPQEIFSTQAAIVNIALDVRKQWRNAPSGMNDVVCYESIAGRVRDMFLGKQIYLVESMAEKIARDCLWSDERILAVWVRVEKLCAVESTRAVGVEFLHRRTRDS